MKKVFILLALISLVFASCSSDDNSPADTFTENHANTVWKFEGSDYISYLRLKNNELLPFETWSISPINCYFSDYTEYDLETIENTTNSLIVKRSGGGAENHTYRLTVEGDELTWENGDFDPITLYRTNDNIDEIYELCN